MCVYTYNWECCINPTLFAYEAALVRIVLVDVLLQQVDAVEHGVAPMLRAINCEIKGTAGRAEVRGILKHCCQAMRIYNTAYGCCTWTIKGAEGIWRIHPALCILHTAGCLLLQKQG